MFETLQPAPSPTPNPLADHMIPTQNEATTSTDDEVALLLIEVDNAASFDETHLALTLSTVHSIVRSSIRRSDLIEQLDSATLAIGLPGSGRIGMTRVADAIRQRVAAQTSTITIGAIHTTEADNVTFEDLVKAARVQLDSARVAGGNRTNWSDWSRPLP